MRAAALVLCASVALAAAGQAPGPAPASPTPAQSSPAGAGNTQQRVAASQKDLSNGIIRGRVVRADTGEPIEGATVDTGIGTQSAFPSSATSDASGRFALRNLPAGRYQLTASANGFSQNSYGSRRPGESGRAIALTAGQVIQNVNVALTKAGVISGVVLDDRGDPLPGAVVAVLWPTFGTNGQRVLGQASRLGLGMEQVADATDDLGRFRLWGLTPGKYYLAAAEPSTESPGFPIRGPGNDASFTLFPGNDAEPQLLDISAGQELSGISLTVKQARMASIRGTVSGREGPTTAEIKLVRHSMVGGGGATQQSTGGTFTLSRLPPGRYTLFARKDDQIAVTPVVLDEADVMIPIVLGNGTTVSGRIVTDSGEVPPNLNLTGVNVMAVAASEPSFFVRGSVKADGSFQLTGVPAPFRLSVTTGTAQWLIESVTMSGTDVMGTILGTASGGIGNVEVVVTQQPTTVTGIVRDGGKPSGDALVFVFAEDEERRFPVGPYFRTLRPEADGRFSIRGLAPGRYLAVAVNDIDSSQANNPEILEPLSRSAIRFTLGHGATQVLTLRATNAP